MFRPGAKNTTAKKPRKTRRLARDKNFVGVAERLFAVLEALGQQPKSGVPLDEITTLSGMPKTTVYRLLYSMNKLGYVDQNPVSDLYSLSGKFFELGANALPYQRLTVIARPLMRRLLLTFGETVNLAVPDAVGVIYIMVLESPKAHRVVESAGNRGYLHCTALGKCIAAYLSPWELEQHLTRHGMPPMTPSTITSRVQLEEELARVRVEGVAIDNEENVEGTTCVSSPIFASGGKPIAALSVAGPSFRVSQSFPAMKGAVRETAEKLSALLGHVPSRSEEGTPASPVQAVPVV